MVTGANLQYNESYTMDCAVKSSCYWRITYEERVISVTLLQHSQIIHELYLLSLLALLGDVEAELILQAEKNGQFPAA